MMVGECERQTRGEGNNVTAESQQARGEGHKKSRTNARISAKPETRNRGRIILFHTAATEAAAAAAAAGTSLERSFPHPPRPFKNREPRIASAVGRAATSTCRHLRTSSAASPSAPPPSSSSPSSSRPRAHRASSPSHVLVPSTSPACASAAVAKGHSPTSKTYATTPYAHTSCSFPV